jgi:hypothetical protein
MVGTYLIASTLVAQVVGAVVGAVVTRALTPRPDNPDPGSALNQAGAGRTQAIRQPVAPHQVIGGRVKTSGVIVFVHTRPDSNDKANGYLYLVHGISSTAVRSIGDVFFFDDPVTLPKYAIVHRISRHLGAADQAADADFVAEIGDPDWGEDHRLRGRAYLATRLTWEPAAYSAGVPNISAIVEGVDDIYDPRTGAVAWHNNTSLFIARWFTARWGMALAWDDLDEASVIAAANVCDERVRVAAGSTTLLIVEVGGSPTAFTGAFTPSEGARVLDVGDGVRLSSSGTLPGGFAADTTYYAIPATGGDVKFAASAALAIAGTAITPTSGGTGTLTVTYYDEARYKLNGMWTLDASKGKVLEQLLSAMAGVAVYIGGKWFIYAGAPAAPVITLDDDDLRGALEWMPKRSMRDRFNGVRATYVNPDANWQPVDAPPLQSATYLAEDAGEELYHDARFPFTTSARAVQRLQKIALELNRRQGTLNFPAKLTAMRLQVWDGVFISSRRYNWSQKQFRVVGWALAEDGGVDLTLQEDDAAVYEWDATEERDSAVQQGVVLPDPSAIAAPAAVTVDTPTMPMYSRVNATIGAVKSIWWEGYDVEFRRVGVLTWSSTGRIHTELISIVEDQAIDIRARAVTRGGVAGAFTENLAPDMPTGLGLDAPTRIAWTNGAGAVEVQVFAGIGGLAEAALATTVPVTAGGPSVLDVGDDSYYWLRSVNVDGNVSNTTEAITVGTPGGAGGGGGGGDGDGGDGDGGGGGDE